MKTFAVLGATALIASSASAQSASQWVGFSTVRTVTAAGNTQYRIYANFNASGLVFLNAFDFGVNIAGQPTQFGTLNARHQDAGEDADGNPLGSWSANVNLLGTTARENDSWVTSSGSGTSGGNDTALDPGFVYPAGSTDRSFIPTAAGWYDATPGVANNVLVPNGAGGYQMLLMQFVRTGEDVGTPSYLFHLKTGFKLAGTTQALYGYGHVLIFIPSPGALAVLGVAGAFGRRRRAY